MLTYIIKREYLGVNDMRINSCDSAKGLNTISDNIHKPRTFSERIRKFVKEFAIFLMIEGVIMAPVGSKLVKNLGLVYAATPKEQQQEQVLKDFYNLYNKLAGSKAIGDTGYINVDSNYGKQLISILTKLGFTQKDDGIYDGDKLVYKFKVVKIEGLGEFKSIEIFDPETKEKIFYDAIATAYNERQIKNIVEVTKTQLAERGKKEPSKEIAQPPLAPLVPTKPVEKQPPEPVEAGKPLEELAPATTAEKLDLDEVKKLVGSLSGLKEYFEYYRIYYKELQGNYNKLTQLLKKPEPDKEKIMEYVDKLAQFLLQGSPQLEVYNKTTNVNNKIGILLNNLAAMEHILSVGGSLAGGLLTNNTLDKEKLSEIKIRKEEFQKLKEQYIQNGYIQLDKIKVPLFSAVGLRLWFAIINDASLRGHIFEEAIPLFKKFDNKDENYRNIFNKIVRIEELRFNYVKGLINQDEFIQQAFEIVKEYGDDEIKKLAGDTKKNKEHDIIKQKLPAAAYTLLSMTELKLLIDLRNLPEESNVVLDRGEAAQKLLGLAKEQYKWIFILENITRPDYKPPEYFNDNVALALANLGINRIISYHADFEAYIYRHYPQQKEEPPLKEVLFYILNARDLKYPFIAKPLNFGTHNYALWSIEDNGLGTIFTNVIDKRFERFISRFISGADQSFWPSVIEFKGEKYNPYIGDYLVRAIIENHPDQIMTATNKISPDLPAFNEFIGSALNTLRNTYFDKYLFDLGGAQMYDGLASAVSLFLWSPPPPKQVPEPPGGTTKEETKPPIPPTLEKQPSFGLRSSGPFIELLRSIKDVAEGNIFVIGDFNRATYKKMEESGINPSDLKSQIGDAMNGKTDNLRKLDEFFDKVASADVKKAYYEAKDKAQKGDKDALRKFLLENLSGYGLGSTLHLFTYKIEGDKLFFESSYGVVFEIGSNLSEQYLKQLVKDNPIAFLNILNTLFFLSFTRIPVSITEYELTKKGKEVIEQPTGKKFPATIGKYALKVSPELSLLAFKAPKFLGDVGVLKVTSIIEFDYNVLDEKIKEGVSFSERDLYFAIKSIGASVEFPVGEGFKLRKIEFGKLDVFNLESNENKFRYDPGSGYGSITFAYTIKPDAQGELKIERIDIYASPTLIYRSGDIPYIMTTLGMSALLNIKKIGYFGLNLKGDYEFRNGLWEISPGITVYPKEWPFGTGISGKVSRDNFGIFLNLDFKW